jgi:hypothetical protein
MPCCAVLPRVKGKTSDVSGFTKEQPLKGISADRTHFLKFYMGPGDKVIIEDVQNNTASFVADAIDVGNVTIYGIDKVLLSGEVLADRAHDSVWAGRLQWQCSASGVMTLSSCRLCSCMRSGVSVLVMRARCGSAGRCSTGFITDGTNAAT